MKKALFLWLFFASLSGYAQTYTDTQLQQHQDSVLRGNSANNVNHPQGRDLLRRLNANKINKVDGASKYDSTQNYTRGSLVFYSGHRWAAADSISIATFPGSSELWQCEDCADGGGGTDPDLTPFSRKDHFAEDFMANSEDYGGISRFLRADPTSPSGYYIQLRIDSSFVGGGGSSFDLTPYLDGVDDFNAVGLSLRGDGKLTANKQFTLAYFNPTGYSTFTSPWGMLLDFNPSYLAGAPFTINLSGSGVDGWIQTITAGSYDYNNLIVTGDGETLLDTIASLKSGESASWIWSNTANKWFRYLKNRGVDPGSDSTRIPYSGTPVGKTITGDFKVYEGFSLGPNDAGYVFPSLQVNLNEVLLQVKPNDFFQVAPDLFTTSALIRGNDYFPPTDPWDFIQKQHLDSLAATISGGGGGGSDTTRIPYSGTEIGKLISGNLAFNNVANLTYDGPDAVNRIKMDDDGSGGIRLVSTHPSHAYRQSYYSVQPGVFSSAASWEDLSDTTQYRTIYLNVDPYSDQIQVATGYSSALKFHGIVDADDYTANYLPGSHINKAYMLFAADSIASALVSGGGTTTNALSAGTGLAYTSGTTFNGSAARTLGIDATVATLTGTQTLTNKTLTSPVINSGSLGSSTVANTQTAGDNSTKVATTAYVDANAVHLTGAESVAGVKTFSSSPILPTASANDNSTKGATTAYVDAKVVDGTITNGVTTTAPSQDDVFDALILKSDKDVPATLTYASTTNIDFSDINSKTESLTGNVTYTTSNLAAGKGIVIRVVSDASSRTLTFPAWKWAGAPAPTATTASVTYLLSLYSWGTTDADVVASWVILY